MATPVNIFDLMMAQGASAVGQSPPVPPPRQYMTPGMSDYVMGQDGAPVGSAPSFVSGAGMTGNRPQPLPPTRHGRPKGPRYRPPSKPRNSSTCGQPTG